MTASGGLQSDASRAVYSEDVVTYVDASDASEWADRALGDGPVGLVSAVAGESDEDDDDDVHDDRPRDDVVDHLRGRPKSDDGPSPPPPANANANDDALSSFPLNFADVFREALARVRTVDDLATLFSDVEPRSRHAEAMRSGGGDPSLGDRPDASAFASAVDPDSVLGLFLRRCVADHERLSFEGACVAFAAFLRYADEAAGCLLDGDDDALEALGVALERASSEGGSLSLARRKHSSAAALRSSALGGDLGGPPSALAASRKLRDETLDGRLLADVAHDGVGDAPPEEGPFPHRRGAASSLSRADDVTAWAPPWRAIAATSAGVRRFERDRTTEGGPEGGPEGFEGFGFGAGSGAEAARDATRIRGSVRGSSFARPDAVVASLVRRASARADADYGDFDRSPNPLEGGFDGGGVIFSGGSLGGALASEAAPSGGGGCGDVHERLGASALPPGHPARHRLRHSASVRTRDVFAADDHLRRRFDARDPWGESGSVGDAAGVGARGGHAADPFSFSLDGGDAPGSSSSAASGAAASAKLQSALLALAATHAAFAHAPEARKALDEATRAAQQRGDEVALAHALAHRVALEENNFPTNEGSSIREDDRTRASIADGGPLDDRVRRRSGGGHARGPGGRFGGSGGGGSALARLASRAAALRQPHLLAFAELASARRAAARVRFSRAPPSSSSGGEGSQGGGSRSSRRRGGRGRRRRGRRRRRRRGRARAAARFPSRSAATTRGDVRARAQADGPRVRARARRARGAARREPRARVRARERRGRCENTLERRRARDESRGGGACVRRGACTRRARSSRRTRRRRRPRGAHQGARRVRIRARGGDVGRARRAEPREARRAQAPPSRRRRFVPPFERRESFGSGGRR